MMTAYFTQELAVAGFVFKLWNTLASLPVSLCIMYRTRRCRELSGGASFF
jgi:hypothetical protein